MALSHLMAFSGQIDVTEVELCPHLSHYSNLVADKKEIRLIRWFDDVEITTWRLDGAPPYHAVSHHWGPATPSRYIKVQGEWVQIRQTITDMFTVLTDLYGRQEYFWLDMLCINQRDLTERNSQVSIMASIYSKALDVISWLGLPTPQSHIAFRIVKEELFCPKKAPPRILGQQAATLPFPLSLSYKLPTAYELEVDDVLYKRFAESVVWPAFTDVLKRPYWERMWVAQEMIVGSRSVLLCGHSRTNLEDFVRVCDGWITKSQHKRYNENSSKLEVELKTEHQSVINIWRPIVKQVQYRLQYKEGRILLMELVDSFANRKCSNLRDKVFALRALSREAATVKVDYSRPVLQVCLDLVQSGLLMSDRGRGFQSLDYLLAWMGFDSTTLEERLKEAPSVLIRIDGGAMGSVVNAQKFSETDSDLPSGNSHIKEVSFVRLVDETGKQPPEYFCTMKSRAARFLGLCQAGDVITRVAGVEPLLLLLQPLSQDNTEVPYLARSNLHFWGNQKPIKFTGTSADPPIVGEIILNTVNREPAPESSCFFIDSKSLSGLILYGLGTAKNYILS